MALNTVPLNTVPCKLPDCKSKLPAQTHRRLILGSGSSQLEDQGKVYVINQEENFDQPSPDDVSLPIYNPLDREHSPIRLDKYKKTNRLPFCREKISVEEMRKPHLSSMGMTPGGSRYHKLRVVMEGRQIPIVTEDPHIVVSDMPGGNSGKSKESEIVCSAPVISPRLPQMKPAILPSLGTSCQLVARARESAKPRSVRHVQNLKGKNLENKGPANDDQGNKRCGSSSSSVCDFSVIFDDSNSFLSQLFNSDTGPSKQIQVRSNFVTEAIEIALAVDNQFVKPSNQNKVKKQEGPNKLKSVKNEKKLPISNDNLMSNRFGEDSITKEHPPKRTVDEIIASLRDGSIQKGTSASDHKIKEIMEGVVSRTKAILGDIDGEEEELDDSASDDDELRCSVSLNSFHDINTQESQGDGNQTMDQNKEDDSIEMTGGEAQLIQEALEKLSEIESNLSNSRLSFHAEEKSVEITSTGVDVGNNDVFDIQQAWESLQLSSNVTKEDILNVVGKSCFPLADQEEPIVLLETWKKMTGKIITKEEKPLKTIHHFCISNDEILLPDLYRGIWKRYEMTCRYNQTMEEQDINNSEFQTNEDNFQRLPQEAAVRILNEANKARDQQGDLINQSKSSMDVALEIRGEKVDIIADSSMLFWKLAPPKWVVAPAEVKKVLFPEYNRSTRTRNVNFESNRHIGTVDSDATIAQSQKLKTASALSRKFGSMPLLAADQDLPDVNKIFNWTQRKIKSADVFKTTSSQMRRSSSAPPGLNINDDDFLLIFQDFDTMCKEIAMQQQQIRDLMNAPSRISSSVNVAGRSTTIERHSSALSEAFRKQAEVRAMRESPLPTRLGHIILPVQDNVFPKRNHSRIAAEAVLILSKEPRNLTRADSMPHLKSVARREFKISTKIRTGTRCSIPNLFDFESFKTSNKWPRNEESNDREAVRCIWNKWFDEVFPPSSRWSEQSESEEECREKESEKKKEVVEKTYPKTVVLQPVIEKDILNPEDVKLLQAEVDRLTNEIEASGKPRAFDLCRRGAILRKLGRIKQSLDDLNSSIELEPDMLDAYWHRHLVSILLNRKKFAILDLDFLLRRNKTNVAAYKSRSMLYAEAGEYNLAINDLTHALKYQPDDADALFRRADLYEKTGNTMLALDDYASCRKSNPLLTSAILKQGMYYFNSENWEAAIHELTTLLDVEPMNFDARLHRGRAYMKLKSWNYAAEDMSIAIHMNPTDWKPFYFRGCIFRKVHPEKALQDFSISLLINDSYDNISSYLHRGILYSDTGRSDDAISDFESVLKLDGSNTSAWVNLGLIYLKNTKNIFRAMRQFTNALRVDPTLIKAYLCRAEAYQRLSDYKNALLDVTRAIHLRPDLLHLYVWRGDLVHKAGDLTLAMYCLKHMSELDVGEGQNPVQQSVMQSFLKNYDKAIEVLKSAVQETPSSSIYTLLGKTQMKANQWIEAVDSFQKSLEMMTEEIGRCPTEGTKEKKKCLLQIGEIYYQIGTCYIETSNFLPAFDAFNSAIKANPKHAESYYWRGVTKLRLHQIKGLQDVNHSLALDPTLFQAYLTRAMYFGMRGQFSKAILNCNEAIKLQPNSIRAYLSRGALKFHMKSYLLAIRDLTKALSIDTTCDLAYFNRAVCYQANGEQQKALQDYGTILLLSNDDSLTLKALTNRSLLYIEIGDYHNALHDLLWAVRLSPKDKSLHHTLGLCYHKVGRLKDAVKTYTIALECDRFFVEALIGRGNAFLDYGHDLGYVFARRDFERVLHLNPLCLPARVNLAYCLQMTGNFMQAWHQFTATIAINPKFVPALEGRAVINLQMNETFAAFQDITASIHCGATAELLTNRGVIHQFMRDKVNAIRDYHRAIQLDSNYALAYYNAANIYFHSHQFQQALRYYDQAVKCSSKDESLYLNRAITKVMLKDALGALEDFEMAAQLSPHTYHIYFNRGNLFMSMQKYAEAEQDYSRADTLKPNDPVLMMKKADALGQLGQRNEAIEIYKRAVELQYKVNRRS